MAINCWEYFKCGREPNGDKTNELGVCPASTESKTNNIHSGKNGGRCCWIISGSLCRRTPKSYNEKKKNCLKCPFYKLVKCEEGANYKSVLEIFPFLRNS